jgi:rhodanese-related sulfurtransferase
MDVEYGVDGRLATARSRLVRLTPGETVDALRRGGLLVDIRPEYQRRADGDIPAAIVVERNHLEWRLDPQSPWRIPEATRLDTHWIVLCDEGYSSSFAAVSLRQLGLVNATDVVGGFQRWRADGCPVIRREVPAPPRVARYDQRTA